MADCFCNSRYRVQSTGQFTIGGKDVTIACITKRLAVMNTQKAASSSNLEEDTRRMSDRDLMAGMESVAEESAEVSKQAISDATFRARNFPGRLCDRLAALGRDGGPCGDDGEQGAGEVCVRVVCVRVAFVDDTCMGVQGDRFKCSFILCWPVA